MAAFSLLAELCRDCEENYLQVLQLIAPHHDGTAPKIESWDYHPSSDDKASCGYVGLKNLGNTCYMNALLQQFYMLPNLRYGVLSIAKDEIKAPSSDDQDEGLVGELQVSSDPNTLNFVEYVWLPSRKREIVLSRCWILSCVQRLGRKTHKCASSTGTTLTNNRCLIKEGCGRIL